MRRDGNRIDQSLPEGRVLHVGAPNIGDREVFDRLVDEIFEQRWFTNNGPKVKQFEDQLCDYLGVKHCIAVCNATTGLQLVCRALGLSGEVILPAYTFIATPHAACWEGLKPRFADVNRRTHSICPESVLPLINDRTSAILAVHLWGRPSEVERLQEIADQNKLKLIFDAAHAFGCQHKQKMIGNFGNCEVFSFHATKFFNTFEGGAIATNDDELADKVRLMRNFGFSGAEGVVSIGINAKMSEIAAAMGLSMFGSIESVAEKNRQNFFLYQKILKDVPGISLCSPASSDKTNWQYVVTMIDEEEFGVGRDQIHQYLHHNGILAKKYFFPGCHRAAPYLNEFLTEGRVLKNTDELCRSVLCLPTGTSISESDIEWVCKVLQSAKSSSMDLTLPYISRKAAG